MKLANQILTNDVQMLVFCLSYISLVTDISHCDFL